MDDYEVLYERCSEKLIALSDDYDIKKLIIEEQDWEIRGLYNELDRIVKGLKTLIQDLSLAELPMKEKDICKELERIISSTD